MHGYLTFSPEDLGIFDAASAPSREMLVDGGMSGSHDESIQLSCSASYRSRLSSTQIPPDTSAIVSTSLSWLRESSTGGIHRGIVKPLPPNVETRKGFPARFPSLGSK